MNTTLKKIYNVFFSLEVAVILSLIFMAGQIYATLGFNTLQEAWGGVYETKWFEAIMWLLGINLIGVMFKYKTYKKTPIFILHLSIIVILIGAAITRYFGYEGTLHLRNGETKNYIMVERSKANPADVYKKDLGFSIKLDKFVLKHYPGSMQPSSYESFIEVIDKNKSFKYHIYMNHILVYKGYRFYQASYDMDGKGSILSVNHDPGMWVAYFGYILMAIGFLWSMIYKKSRFMMTVRKLKQSGLFAFLLFILFSGVNARAFDLGEFAKKSKTVSDEWAKVLVQQRGRIEPMDTLDLDIVHKLTLKSKLYGLNYNQIVAGMVAYPEEFQKLPLIYVGHPAIRKLLGIEGKYAPYNAFFMPNGDFKFTKEIDKAFKIPDKDRTVLDREWIKLNERVYIAFEVYTAKIFKIFPTPNSKMMNYRWFSIADLQNAVKSGMMNPIDAQFYFNLFKNLADGIKTYNVELEKKTREKIYELQKTYSGEILPSESRIKWEIFYNRAQIFPMLIGIYSTLGLIAMFLGFFEIIRQKRFKKIETLIVGLGWLALILHTANMLLRWYISGHAPWSDAYESIIFIAWGSAFASVFFFRKSMLALGAGLFVAGMFMMVAHLNNINPQITNLVPVLKSYWLLIHVAVITSSYGFLAVGGMLGFLNLILFAMNKKYNLENQIKQLNNVIYLALYIGLALLSVGTFLGGVWANESWGRYWSWDPKETWSLISMIVYAITIHGKMIPKLRGEFIFSLLSFLAFFYILFTYFGVNFYIAQGLHSYGQGVADGYGWVNILFAGMGAWFVVVLVSIFMAISSKISKPVVIKEENKNNDYHPQGENNGM
ncbi:cytochrome c biogenesis protein CcsA [Caminibacter mediatlanticus]|uniref:Nrfi protein n=1 Tax=Caminibacter mediatlanticus TB-2 TaxID=391592 RepID=A0AAI9AI23_9BACT|nr:cytochrome c biogenesis protein CcsA [Caminibacter mediatlanticus]EDM24016.1 nrfi protein [Caminibacter mediatlanticus TB-2]